MVDKRKKSKKSQHQKQDQISGGAVETNSGHSHHHASLDGEDLIYVSPSRIRFQHSRIRPYFSGCGRSVMETLEEIRRGELEPRNLPPIQVLIGPDEHDGLGPWYFSLNNRRLWVLKQCHKEGLLDNVRYNNSIAVRVRAPKSGAEAQRYTVENCALDAKFTREGEGGRSNKKRGNKKKGAIVPSEKDGHLDGGGDPDDIIGDGASKNTPIHPCHHGGRRYEICNGYDEKSDNGSNGDSDSDDGIAHKNPFSALY
ncbi:hypothetical protein ACHAW5_010852 [Stephanodiscus triporus]|uniref:Uncharacterized protein n=1 Tax=Stephanodiscus triporus TaxID=2934178 RepID=A0ABD3NKR7_9STRA